ncbi:MAG: hypothetical protein ABSD72_00495 [Terracidiphilus sp.]
MHALISGIANQLKHVFALQRVSACEDKDGNAHIGDLIDQRLPFGVGELVGVGNGLSGGATMLASQVAGLRYLPDCKERGFIKVQSAASGDVVHRLHEASCGIMAGRT